MQEQGFFGKHILMFHTNSTLNIFSKFIFIIIVYKDNVMNFFPTKPYIVIQFIPMCKKLYYFLCSVMWDSPGGPAFRTSPSNLGNVVLISSWGAKVQHASGQKAKA